MSRSDSAAGARRAAPARSATAPAPDEATCSGSAMTPGPSGANAAPRPRALGASASTPAPAGDSAGSPRHRQPRVGVAAVQGAFVEHAQRLRGLGCTVVELRQRADLDRPLDALVLPGGESTTQSRLLRDAGLLGLLRDRIVAGLPTLGTCAGLILLAEGIEGSGDLRGLDPQTAAGRSAVEGLRTLPVTVSRNAYGRQLGSFHAQGTWQPAARPTADGATPASAPDAAGQPTPSTLMAADAAHAAGQPVPGTPATETAFTPAPVPLTFIRAPRIERLGPGVSPLVTLDGRPVAVQHGAQIGAAFHPELDDDNRLYRHFLDLIS